MGKQVTLIVFVVLCSMTWGCADDTSDGSQESPEDAGEGADAGDGETDDGDSGVDGGGDTGNDASECTPEAETRCHDGDSYWFDSCGERGERRETCEGECQDGSCGEPDGEMTWEIDDSVVYETTSVEAGHVEANEHVYVYLPAWGRNLQIDVTDPSSVDSVDLSCDDDWGVVSLGLITSDNGHSDLDDVPGEWQDLNLNEHQCGEPTADGDEITRWRLELTSVEADHVVGSFALTVEGGGSRSGSTLDVHGNFDVEPEAQ